MKRETDRLGVFFLTFSILTALFLPFCAAAPDAEDAALYDRVIRLHVLANSDSEADQADKLAVRDAVLAEAARLTDGVTALCDAKCALEANLDGFRETAESVLRSRGSEEAVRVTLTRERYPTRTYAGFALPAGSYDSLRVMIGDAAGHNWWCILFPQLCTAAALSEKAEGEVLTDGTGEKLLAAGLTPRQIRLITGSGPDIAVRFRLLEWFEEMFGK